MAAETYDLPEFTDDLQAGRPGVVLHRTVKRDISDSGASNNKLAEVGDKVRCFKLPKYSRLFELHMGAKNVDTANPPAAAWKGVVDDGTTEFIFIPAAIVPASGAWELRKSDVEHIGDMLDVADCEVWIEATAAPTTAGTTGVEVYAHAEYAIERAGVDPA